jgi:hypothetical protein
MTKVYNGFPIEWFIWHCDESYLPSLVELTGWEDRKNQEDFKTHQFINHDQTPTIFSPLQTPKKKLWPPQTYLTGQDSPPNPVLSSLHEELHYRARLPISRGLIRILQLLNLPNHKLKSLRHILIVPSRSLRVRAFEIACRLLALVNRDLALLRT